YTAQHSSRSSPPPSFPTRRSSDLTTTEPVDQEDLWQEVSALVTHVDPVLQVVTSVVTNEWQHCHWVVAQGANLSFSRRCGLTGCQQGADHCAVLRVKGLGNQWDGACPAAAEQDGVKLYTLPVIKFRCSSWALCNRGAVAGV